MKKMHLVAILSINGIALFAQKPNWQNMDLKDDGFFGASVNKAYEELLKDKTSNTVVVAVIDSGTDTLHEDLRPVLWTDKITGTHGWNFVGAETGREDVTQLAADRKDLYDSLSYTFVPEPYRVGYRKYRTVTPVLEDKIAAMESLVKTLEKVDKIVGEIITRIGNKSPALADLEKYDPSGNDQKAVVKLIRERWPLYKDFNQLKNYEIDQILQFAKYHLQHGLNMNNNEADTARGDTNVSPDHLGLVDNPNLTAHHGTHVAGIIGAVRNNGLGMEGVADNVRIMTLKTLGNIRELRDKSLAAAIRYAADHGAKVINLSFGKPYSWDKTAVDDAVKYAIKKDVLILHAAGNDSKNLDEVEHYPNPVYLDKGFADAWIEVGASRHLDDTVMIAAFSNYGKRSVDIFAPGTNIYSTVPYSAYDTWHGTSMATPVVSGVAALIRGYYPKLTAVQVKEIIMKSVARVNHKVYVLDKNGRLITVPFSETCVSGGVVNAYNALKLAATYK